jgi:hypothetical protein
MKKIIHTCNETVLPFAMLLAALAWVWGATNHVYSLVS